MSDSNHFSFSHFLFLLGDYVLCFTRKSFVFFLHLPFFVWILLVLGKVHLLSWGYKLSIPVLTPLKSILLVSMKPSLSSMGLEHPLTALKGAIKLCQPWDDAAVAWVYCCISQAWITDTPQLLFCSGNCPVLLYMCFFIQFPLHWQHLADLKPLCQSVERPLW